MTDSLVFPGARARLAVLACLASTARKALLVCMANVDDLEKTEELERGATTVCLAHPACRAIKVRPASSDLMVCLDSMELRATKVFLVSLAKLATWDDLAWLANQACAVLLVIAACLALMDDPVSTEFLDRKDRKDLSP